MANATSDYETTGGGNSGLPIMYHYKPTGFSTPHLKKMENHIAKRKQRAVSVAKPAKVTPQETPGPKKAD